MVLGLGVVVWDLGDVVVFFGGTLDIGYQYVSPVVLVHLTSSLNPRWVSTALSIS